jgi:hypothetical protein
MRGNAGINNTSDGESARKRAQWLTGCALAPAFIGIEPQTRFRVKRGKALQPPKKFGYKWILDMMPIPVHHQTSFVVHENFRSVAKSVCRGIPSYAVSLHIPRLLLPCLDSDSRANSWGSSVNAVLTDSHH